MQFSALPESGDCPVGLRPLCGADLSVLFSYLSLPQTYELTSRNLSSPEELADYIGSSDSVAPSTSIKFGIIDRVSDELIGTAGFHTVSPVNRSAELSYDLTPKAWGKGIARQVCELLTTWAHTQAGMIRVQATVLEANVRSTRVLERCQYWREGLLRSYRMVRGRPGDFFMYSHVELPATVR